MSFVGTEHFCTSLNCMALPDELDVCLGPIRLHSARSGHGADRLNAVNRPALRTKMICQSWSLIAGAVAFGIYAVVMAATSGFGLMAAFFSVLVAFVAGCFKADAPRFFAGLTLALCCWIALGLVAGTASERSSAIVLVPVVLTMAFGLGAIAFFAGHLTRRIAETLKS
jgi:hypothetical protein